MSDKKGKDNAKADKQIDFAWGKTKGRGKGGKDKDVQFYESFRFDGVEYSLYDCVYLLKKGETVPYIGKLLKIYQRNNDKKVKILWFFRPSEIANYVEGVELADATEIFLATGDGVGLANLNPLEAIAGKCNVVCISKDERNRQPSKEELEEADFMFYRTFDVQNRTISDKLDKSIAMVDVKLLLNKNGPQPVDLAKPLVPANDTLVADRLVECNSTVASPVVKADKLISGLPEKLGTAVSDNTANDTLVADRLVECNATVASPVVKADKLIRGLPEKLGTAVSDNTAKLRCGEEITVSNKDSLGVDGVMTCDANLGSLLAEEDKLSKHTELTVTTTDNGKSQPLNDVKKRAVAEKEKSENRPSNKLKLEGIARKSIGNGVTGTQKSANTSPGSNNVSRQANSSAEISNGSKRTRELIGNCDTPLGKKLSGMTDDKSNDKPVKVLVTQSKDSLSKPPQHASGATKSNDKRKLSREQDDANKEVNKKRRTDSVIEDKPLNKLGKLSIKQPKEEEIEASTQVKDVTQRQRALKLGKLARQPKKEEVGAYNQVKDVTQRPRDKSKWFTANPWEERMKEASDQGKLVLLQNLDPTYSPNEVENIIWHGFNESCTVKLVQHTATSSKHVGQAFAIFDTPEVAEKVIKKLATECLMLPNGRPLVGTNGIMSLPPKQSQYSGHLALGRLRLRMMKDKDLRDAVSTSHSSQTNTLEYEMALEWRLLQERSDMSWKLLYQRQEEETRKLMASMKSK